jgi:O-antigen/teichoic acid export membrane protein
VVCGGVVQKIRRMLKAEISKDVLEADFDKIFRLIEIGERIGKVRGGMMVIMMMMMMLMLLMMIMKKKKKKKKKKLKRRVIIMMEVMLVMLMTVGC